MSRHFGALALVSLLGSAEGRAEQGASPADATRIGAASAQTNLVTGVDDATSAALSATAGPESTSDPSLDVVIIGERPREQASRTSIEAAAIEKVPGAAGDPLAVAQNFAGVARSSLGSGDLIVRGSGPADSQIFVDGIQIPTAYHFQGLRSVLPLGAVDGIDFFPGNFGVAFGRASGGVLDVRSKTLAPERIGGYVDLNLYDASLFVAAPTGEHGAVAIGARRSYIDTVLGALLPSDTGLSVVTAPSYYDYQMIGNYQPGPEHAVSALFFGSHDGVKLLFKNPTDLFTQGSSGQLANATGFYRTILGYTYVPDERFKNELHVASGRDRIKFSIGDLALDIDSYLAQVRDTLRLEVSHGVALGAGVDSTFTKTDASFALPRPQKEGEPPANTNLDDLLVVSRKGLGFWSPAAFAQLELEPLEGLDIVAGVRADYFGRLGAMTLDPRVSARYSLTHELTAKAAIGRFHQEPFFDETDAAFGNPDLKPIRATHYMVGGEWSPKEFVHIDVTAFYKTLEDLVSRTDAVVMTQDGVRPLVYDNHGYGRVVGLEVTSRHDFTRNFYGWIAYTVSRAERRDSGQQTFRPFDYDQTHVLTVLGTYKLPFGLEAGGRWRYVTGNPTTPIVGATYNADTDQYDPIYGRTNSARIGPFHQLDLRLDKRWTFALWQLNAYVDAQNVYNRKNPEGRTFNYNYTQHVDGGGLPIVAIIGLKAEI